MSIHDHDILVPFAGELICQRQSKDACANNDNPVVWAHHSRVELLDVLQANALRKLVIVNGKNTLCSRENGTIVSNSFTPYLLIPDK
jgi:hypothetical protein